jgi:hypothetical protein
MGRRPRVPASASTVRAALAKAVHPARLVTARRRDWAEALWAEAGPVPSGLARLTRRFGRVWLMAREARLVRRVGPALVFAAAVVWATRAAWPGPAGNAATVVARVDVVTVALMLAGLPLLSRWLLGPAAAGRLAWVLRAGVYAAILVLIVAKAGVEQTAGNLSAGPPLSSGKHIPALGGLPVDWIGESLFLLVMAAYVTAFLALTTRRSRMAATTLAAGAAAGVVFGLILYALVPLGIGKAFTSPWLSGGLALLVPLALIMLFSTPLVAGSAAARCYQGPGSRAQQARARIMQGGAAGFLAAGVGALVASVLGTGTIALMPRAGWLLGWLYPGQHLLAATAYHRELAASANAAGYLVVLLIFPIVGLGLGLAAGDTEKPPLALLGEPTGPGTR